MIPNIVRGDRMGGLMAYLVGPGRSNEHTEPHLVAGDDALMAWHSDNELGIDSARAIARHLDLPRTAYDVDVKGGHVWHCSLSLRAEEGQLSDERWREIAEDFIRAMEFDDNDGTKAPCRWVAVRHGVSTNGNDHVHVAVNLVREDGTKASLHNDFRRAQAAARALEAKYGLEELESAKDARATRGYHPAERQAQARARARAKCSREGGPHVWEALDASQREALVKAALRDDEPRVRLAVKVRGAATASADEAEFVRRLRRGGLIVRPRFADGSNDVITGYSVAEAPRYGERPIWYGGGRLGRDLTLPRLRSEWPDSPQGASSAAAEWAAAGRGRRVVAAGRETFDFDPETWTRQAEDLARLAERLRSVPVEDRQTWATVARQGAGALAAWSGAVEDTPGDLAHAAEALSRSAQTRRPTVTPQRAGATALSGAAMLLASTAHGGKGAVGQAAMIRSLLRLTQSVWEAALAADQARQARLLADEARGRLARVRDRLDQSTAPGSTTATLERTTVLDPEAQAVLDRLSAGRGPARDTAPIPAPISPPVRPPSTAPTRGPER